MKQILGLTGLRGVAAYSVLIAHAISSSFLYNGVNELQQFASRLAYFGMSLFFVLSGFVIHHNYAKVFKSEGIFIGGYQFIVARIARLYPLYIVFMICTLDSIPSKFFHNKDHAEYVYMLMMQSWFNLQDLAFKPAWSISTEWFFYFTFLFLFPALALIKRPIITLVFFIIITFFLLPYLLNWQVSKFSNNNGWIIYFSPYTRIFDFIAGVFSSIIFTSIGQTNQAINKKGICGLILAVIWCLFIIVFDILRGTKYSILLSNFIYTPAIASLLILVCRYEILDKLLSNKYMIFMGEISYSVYLLGFVVMTALASTYLSNKPTLMAHINSIIKVISIIIFTTLIAYGGYHLIEKPSRNFIRKILSPKGKQKMIFNENLL